MPFKVDAMICQKISMQNFRKLADQVIEGLKAEEKKSYYDRASHTIIFSFLQRMYARSIATFLMSKEEELNTHKKKSLKKRVSFSTHQF
jgi:hypothetical protein